MRCVEIVSYTIPMFGNRHSLPYGKMLAEHKEVQKIIRFGEIDGNGRSFIIFNRRRYYFRNVGSLYAPKFEFDQSYLPNSRINPWVRQIPK